MTNRCLILSQRILDLLEESGIQLAEQEAALEVVRVVVRQSMESSSGLAVLADESAPEDPLHLS